MRGTLRNNRVDYAGAAAAADAERDTRGKCVELFGTIGLIMLTTMIVFESVEK